MVNEYASNKNSVKWIRRLNLRKLTSIVGRLLLALLIFEVGRILLGNFSQKPVVAKWDIVEKGCWAEALFLREEMMLKSPAEGVFTASVKEGTRVPRGEVLAIVDTKGNGDNHRTYTGTEPELKQLLKLQTLKWEIQALNSDLLRIQAEIQNQKRISKPKHMGKAQTNEDLIYLEQEKARIIRSIHQARFQAEQLQNKLANRFDTQIPILASDPGYVFYQYDQVETKLTPDHFGDLTENDFNHNYSLKKTGPKIKVGEIYGKIVNPFHQVTAVLVDTTETGVPKLGKSWWLKKNTALTKVMITKQIPLQNGKMIVALDDDAASELQINRRSRLFVVYRRTAGVCIPNRALYKENGAEWVKVVKGDGYRLQKVRILESDDNKVIIEGIEFGTTIITR